MPEAQKAKDAPVSKAENFSEWYNDLVERAELIDKRYPVKGMDVWRPYGLALMNAVDREIHAQMTATGHQEVRFPALVPETEFQKEADQIKGFGSNVYWVTRGGNNDLDVKLLLRPTSETAMYPIFSLWVRSHADLPLKTYQIVNTWRYETKQTRSFIRVREIHFFEAHTVHATYEDAEAQIAEDLAIWSRLAEKLCLPYALNRRPDWDKFPGARYSIGADVLMPRDAQIGAYRTLQVATIHQYGDNFAKPYDIRYETPGGERLHAHQTTYGMSERLLGAIVGVHGDDLGLLLPPQLAPVQAVIVPILFKGKEGPVLESCHTAARELAAAGIRAHVDERDLTAGNKYYHWELRGVPLRVEIGPRDVEKGEAVLVRRDTKEKTTAKRPQLSAAVGDVLAKVQTELYARAQGIAKGHETWAKDAADAKRAEGVALVNWCGKESCGLDLETKTEKAILGVPVRPEFTQGKLTFVEEMPPRGACVTCGTAGKHVLRVARTY
ncbi:MAG TPA: proline--tRNA ligase [Candidatus Thermoplasmatota archaeon]|nr:proline--tRNA ligase [Candidatus Thermoplasmatota archaeon]